MNSFYQEPQNLTLDMLKAAFEQPHQVYKCCPEFGLKLTCFIRIHTRILPRHM
jgi:hypothetical protein